MNKAFIREPDPTDRLYCPGCGSLGVLVRRETLDAQVAASFRDRLGDSAYYCPFAQCSTAYFDAFDRSVTVNECRSALYPKHPAAPICGCFGFTIDEIEADLRDKTVARTRAAVAQAKTSQQCVSCSATGQSCVAEIQRYYMQRKQQSTNVP